MPSRYLHALTCTKCGAALPVEEGQQLVACRYCGQTHLFAPPPAPAPPALARSDPRSGRTALLVALGLVVAGTAGFVALAALSRSTAESPPTGTSESAGPGDPALVYSKDQPVDIHWGSSWWPGSVVAVDGKRYRAHYDGYGASSDEWVTARRLRPRAPADAGASATADSGPIAAGTDGGATPAEKGGDPNARYEAGQKVDIFWGSRWWAGTVKKKDGARYFVGYDGWSSGWDEWVTAERLRPRER